MPKLLLSKKAKMFKTNIESFLDYSLDLQISVSLDTWSAPNSLCCAQHLIFYSICCSTLHTRFAVKMPSSDSLIPNVNIYFFQKVFLPFPEIVSSRYKNAYFKCRLLKLIATILIQNQIKKYIKLI